MSQQNASIAISKRNSRQADGLSYDHVILENNEEYVTIQDNLTGESMTIHLKDNDRKFLLFRMSNDINH